MNKLKLKAILFNVDFRKNEFTNFQDFRKHKSFPGDLDPGEVFLFVSKGTDQLIWFMRHFSTEEEKTIVDSRKWRMLHGTWNPDLLANYAHEAGIELVGLRTFEEGFNSERERKKLPPSKKGKESQVFLR